MLKMSTSEVNYGYEIRAKPHKIFEIYLGKPSSKEFKSYLNILQYGEDGEVI
jgi:hypothetical protein